MPVPDTLDGEIRPDYYDTTSLYEPWKVIFHWKLNYHEASALVYILRARVKHPRGPQEDYRKAATHLMQLVREFDAEEHEARDLAAKEVRNR